MLVTSSQSSTQRPLGLSVEELFALDRQYRRLEQQQQQHLAQLQTQTHISSTSNLNRLASRSLDLVAAPPANPLTILPSLEIHGHGYITNRPHPPPSTILQYPRSHSIDHFRYIPQPPPPPFIKHTYPQRHTLNDTGHQQHYQSKYKTYLQQPSTSSNNGTLSGNSFMYDLPTSSVDYSDNRGSCKLRRQQPLKRESSRRIVVRPVVHRRREPSVSSSCESLDEQRTSNFPRRLDSDTINTPVLSSSSTEDSLKPMKQSVQKQTYNDSSSDEGETNLYEMRVPIGRTYDTSDISVQLEGPKILIHCHTIEPTDKRGNYRKHELKTELYVPDVVDDETIVAYLTEDGELIVEGKYHQWAWREIKKKRYIEQKESNTSSSSPVNTKVTTTKHDSGTLLSPFKSIIDWVWNKKDCSHRRTHPPPTDP
ncbi:hypothetical protein I4U23_001552 [Adineta vaga]|nr:hypothetical protein I4U23_001552 [Adineta vaga]